MESLLRVYNSVSRAGRRWREKRREKQRQYDLINDYQLVADLPEACQKVLSRVGKYGWANVLTEFFRDYESSDTPQIFEDCFKEFIRLKNGVIINYVSYETGCTFIHIAAKKGRWNFIRNILETREANAVEILDHDVRPIQNETVRELLKKNLPDLEKSLPDKKNSTSWTYLYFLLRHKEQSKFCEALQNLEIEVCGETMASCMQYASTRDLTEALEIFFEIFNFQDSQELYGDLIYSAARLGYPELLKQLLDRISNEDGIVVETLNFELDTPIHAAAETQSDVHFKCLQILLKMLPASQWQYQEDYYGCRAIESAGMLENATACMEMVNYITDISAIVRSESHKGAVDVDPEILETFISRKVSDIHGRIHIDYSFLAKIATDKPEDHPLMVLSKSPNPELCEKLKHPVLATYIQVMWDKFKRWFYINCALFIVYCAFLTCYTTALGVQDTTISIILRIILSLLLAGIMFRELVQLISHPWLYVKVPDNYLEMPMIGFSVYVIVNDCGVAYQTESVCAQVNSAAMFFTWLSMLLLLGSHPRLSVQMSIVIKVLSSFLHLLGPYFFLIITFTLSFYTLFRGESQGNPFNDVGLSFFRVIMMSGGEYDSDFLNTTGRKIGFIGFVLFILLVPILMINLLIAFAVADIKETREAADTMALSARARYIVTTSRNSKIIGNQLANISKWLRGICMKATSSSDDSLPMWKMTIDYQGKYSFKTPHGNKYGKLDKTTIKLLRSVKDQNMYRDGQSDSFALQSVHRSSGESLNSKDGKGSPKSPQFGTNDTGKDCVTEPCCNGSSVPSEFIANKAINYEDFDRSQNGHNDVTFNATRDKRNTKKEPATVIEMTSLIKSGTNFENDRLD